MKLYNKHTNQPTALLRVQNDFPQAIDKRECGVLILLDRSTAFDAVRHSVLLQRLSDHLNVKGTSLNWFESYLSDSTQSVVVSGESSHSVPFSCGIPQGSVLGPILFTVYTLPLGNIIQRYEIYFHLYADDTQRYIFFKPARSGFIALKSLLHQCVAEIRMWMRQNFLKLNSDKTEVILISTWQQLANNVYSSNTYSNKKKKKKWGLIVVTSAGLCLDLFSIGKNVYESVDKWLGH